MEKNDILAFRNSIANYSIEELKAEEKKLNNQVAQMLLDSDLTMKIAIVRAALEEKEGK